MNTKHRLALAIGAALLVAACEPEPRSQRITPEFLEDRDRVLAVANRLEPADREVFGRYVFSRAMVGSPGSSPLVMADGKDPQTVGEAIAIQRWSDSLLEEYRITNAPNEAVILNMGEGLSTEEYNAHVHASNAIRQDYQARLDAGPPPDLMTRGR